MDILYFIEQLEMRNKHKKKFTPIVNHKNTNVLFYLSIFLKHSKMRKSYFLSKKQKKK